jgi:hypothetical protein
MRFRERVAEVSESKFIDALIGWKPVLVNDAVTMATSAGAFDLSILRIIPPEDVVSGELDTGSPEQPQKLRTETNNTENTIKNFIFIIHSKMKLKLTNKIFKVNIIRKNKRTFIKDYFQ